MPIIRNMVCSGRARLRAVAVAVLCLFLALVALATSPALHQVLHADANDPGHHCAVTHIAKGHVDVPISLPPLAPCPALTESPPVKVISFAGRVAYQPPGRGPPQLFA